MKFKIKRKIPPTANAIVCNECGYIYKKGDTKKPCKHIIRVMKSRKSIVSRDYIETQLEKGEI